MEALDGILVRAQKRGLPVVWIPWGLSTDVPTPGDYDGDDGKMDASIFRPSAATWYVDRSTAGVLIQQFGVTTDLPVPSAYVP